MLLLFFLLIFLQQQAAWYITFPSSQFCKEGWVADFYHWDTEDHNTTNIFEGTYPIPFSRNSQCLNGNTTLCVDQDFCTGFVDSIPPGSYCFYQNRQNGNI